jgi:hypothetical protein
MWTQRRGEAVWLLVIILLAQVPGLDQTTVLKTFETYLACQAERNRIGFDMAMAYEQDHSFNIVCVKNVTVREKVKT